MLSSSWLREATLRTCGLCGIASLVFVALYSSLQAPTNSGASMAQLSLSAPPPQPRLVRGAYNSEAAREHHLQHAASSEIDSGIAKCLDLIGQAPPDKPQRLAIIISVSEGRQHEREINATTSSWRAFSEANGYTLHMAVLPANVEGGTHFFIRRCAGVNQQST
jgi:hypothetical protein